MAPVNERKLKVKQRERVSGVTVCDVSFEHLLVLLLLALRIYLKEQLGQRAQSQDCVVHL